jgi:hypothetical protein
MSSYSTICAVHSYIYLLYVTQLQVILGFLSERSQCVGDTHSEAVSFVRLTSISKSLPRGGATCPASEWKPVAAPPPPDLVEPANGESSVLAVLQQVLYTD